jgi:hypothetical protein
MGSGEARACGMEGDRLNTHPTDHPRNAHGRPAESETGTRLRRERAGSFPGEGRSAGPSETFSSPDRRERTASRRRYSGGVRIADVARELGSRVLNSADHARTQRETERNVFTACDHGRCPRPAFSADLLPSHDAEASPRARHHRQGADGARRLPDRPALVGTRILTRRA